MAPSSQALLRKARHLLFVVGDSPQEFNTSWWLCRLPAGVLKRHGVKATITDLDSFGKSLNVDHYARMVKTADVIIMERACVGNFRRAVGYWAKRIPVVFRFDDHYDHIPSYTQSHGFWKQDDVYGISSPQGVTSVKGSYPTLEQFLDTMDSATAISAPNRYLLKYYGKYVPEKPQIYIPNRHDPVEDIWDAPAKYPHEGLWLGWGGSSGHLESWQKSNIVPVLALILRKFPQVKLALAGGNTHIEKHLLANGIREEDMVKIPQVPHPEWPSVVKSFDIGLAPIAGEYDKGRSWIKCLEYGAAGIPWVASNHAKVYAECDGGFLPNNTTFSWEQQLTGLIQHPVIRQIQAVRGKAWADEQQLDLHIDEYIKLTDL